MPTIHSSSSSVHPESTAVQPAFGLQPSGRPLARRSGPPCGRRKGDHGGMELKPEPSRPAVLATGIIDGMPECALACAAGMAPCRRTASQPEGLPTALLRPRRLAPTTHRQRWPDPYPRRSRARLRQCRRCLTEPDRLGRPRFVSRGTDARASSGRAARREELGKHAAPTEPMSRTTKTTNRWPRTRGCPGPAAMRALLQGHRHFGDELRTRRHDRFDVRPAGRAGGLGGCGGLRCQPAESTVCGGLMNGVTCDAVGGGAGVAVHDGGVLGPTSRRRKPQLLRSPERSAPGYS